MGAGDAAASPRRPALGAASGSSPSTGPARAPELALAALRAGRLRLALQPVRPARGRGPVAFHEALARVEGPEGGVIAAGAFAQELERRGHAPALDRAALTLALALLRRDPGARISVNVSALTIADPAWMRLLAAEAGRRPETPRRLIVELTETARADPEAAARFRTRIAALGPAFALDDYGAGWADAELARALRPDLLKLDAALCAGGAGPGLAEALDLAAELEAMTVAEGVSGPEAARRLADLGVDALQGAWTGAPALVRAVA